MKKVASLALAALVVSAGMMASAAMAQTTATTAMPPADPNNAAVTQRDINQQNRIEQGLQSGQLTTGEAARLEKGEAHIDQMESNADKNGSISATEKARIEQAESHESQAIYNQKHDAQTGHPSSVSSQRMQADVQRDANQQKRIENGEQTGSMTPREAGRAEGGQAKDSRKEYRAGRNGHISPDEQAHVQTAEDRQSNHIYNEKHDARATPAGQ